MSGIMDQLALVRLRNSMLGAKQIFGRIALKPTNVELILWMPYTYLVHFCEVTIDRGIGFENPYEVWSQVHSSNKRGLPLYLTSCMDGDVTALQETSVWGSSKNEAFGVTSKPNPLGKLNTPENRNETKFWYWLRAEKFHRCQSRYWIMRTDSGRTADLVQIQVQWWPIDGTCASFRRPTRFPKLVVFLISNL